MQNKILRCIFYMGKFESTDAVYSEHKLLDFFEIHKCFVIFFIFKSIRNLPGINMFKFVDSPYAIRGRNLNLVCPQFRTTLFKNCIFYLGPQLWNSLPVTIKELVNIANFFNFKRKTKDYFSLH